jgi:hypothetical protein
MEIVRRAQMKIRKFMAVSMSCQSRRTLLAFAHTWVVRKSKNASLSLTISRPRETSLRLVIPNAVSFGSAHTAPFPSRAVGRFACARRQTRPALLFLLQAASLKERRIEMLSTPFVNQCPDLKGGADSAKYKNFIPATFYSGVIRYSELCRFGLAGSTSLPCASILYRKTR